MLKVSYKKILVIHLKMKMYMTVTLLVISNCVDQILAM